MSTSGNSSHTFRQTGDIRLEGEPLLEGAAHEILRQPDSIGLNQVESQRFVKALLARSKAPSKRLKDAIALYRATVMER